MADNRNNDQSLITNNNYNRDNSTNSNTTDMYLEQVASTMSDVAEGLSVLRKEIKESGKQTTSNTKKLIDSIDKLNSTTKKTSDNKEKNDKKEKTIKDKIIDDLEDKLNELSKTIRNIDNVIEDSNGDVKKNLQNLKKLQEKAHEDAKNDLEKTKNASESDLRLKEKYNNLFKESYNSFENQLKNLEDTFSSNINVISERLESINKLIKSADTEEQKRLQKEKKLYENRLQFETIKHNKDKYLLKESSKLAERKNELENEYILKANKALKKDTDGNILEDNSVNAELYKRLDDFVKLSTEAKTNENTFFSAEIDSLINKMTDALNNSNFKQYDDLKKRLESYNEMSNTTNTIKGMNPALFDMATNSTALVTAYKKNAVKSATENSGLMEELNKIKTDNTLSAEIINDKLKQGGINDEEKKKLEKELDLINKQNEVADTILAEFNSLFAAIADGNKKEIKAKEKAIKRTVKQFDKISEDTANLSGMLGETIQNAYKPQGTIANIFSKALKKAVDTVIDYGRDLQVNALTSLQSSYEGSGQDIMKRTLSTRYEVLDMVENIGNELENKIRGIDTTEVLQSASSLADAGIRNSEQYGDMLDEMSVVIAEMSTFNPDAAAEFYDEENLRTYYKIWVNAAEAGQDGAEALRDYLYKGASEAYLASQAVGNSFWSANGRLVELDTALADAVNDYGLTTEKADDARKAIYGLGALVGSDITDFNAWITEFMNLPKEGIKGEAQNIIQGVTHGEDIINAINSGNFKDAMVGAYKELLTYGQDNNFNYNESYKMLMNTLGIDSTSISKIVNDKRFFEDGVFSIEKFLSDLENVYAEMENTAKADEKYKEIIVEGKGQTVEAEYEKEVINDMTDSFARLVQGDVPYSVKMEIAAINEAANLLEDTINAGIDMLLSGGSGLGGTAGAVLGGAGKASAVIAAGVIGWEIGTAIYKAADLDTIIKDMTKRQYNPDTLIDKQEEYLDKHLPDVEDNMSKLVEEMKQSNVYNEKLVSFEEQRIEFESGKKAKAESASSSLGTYNKAVYDDDGNVTGTESASASELLGKSDKDIRDAFTDSGGTMDDTAYTDFKKAQADIESYATTIAGGAAKATTADERNTYLENMRTDLLADESFDTGTVNYMMSVAKQELDKIDEQKKVLDDFNSKMGATLYEVYERSKEYEATEGDNAWEKAFSEIAGGSYIAKQYHETGAVPEINKDISVDETNKVVTILPGAYTRSNASSAETSGLFGNADYAPQNWGRFATGLDNVPYDDYPALLHEGERVLTATENKLYETGLNELINSLDSLGLVVYGNNHANSNNTDVVNSINNQTSNISSIVSNIISILQVIATNTGNSSVKTMDNKKDSYFTNAVLSGAMGLQNYMNPSIYG